MYYLKGVVSWSKVKKIINNLIWQSLHGTTIPHDDKSNTVPVTVPVVPVLSPIPSQLTKMCEAKPVPHLCTALPTSACVPGPVPPGQDRLTTTALQVVDMSVYRVI